MDLFLGVVFARRCSAYRSMCAGLVRVSRDLDSISPRDVQSRSRRKLPVEISLALRRGEIVSAVRRESATRRTTVHTYEVLINTSRYLIATATANDALTFVLAGLSNIYPMSRTQPHGVLNRTSVLLDGRGAERERESRGFPYRPPR